MKSKKEFKKFVEQNESIRELQSKIEKDWKKKEEVAESQKLLEDDGYEFLEVDDRGIFTKIGGENFMAGIPPKIEIEMNGKKLPSIQKINRYELDSFMKRDDIVRGELFIDEDTGDLYVVDKGDLETYWLRMGRIEKEKEKKKEEEKLEAFEQNENPFLN